mmetsp:Transcript_21929/g.40006  ORF Transcript_21929/g.40006 Transcript_21929/m.40006 type:complete len:240 (-) Transcript_21929:31-750(-)
MSITKAPKALSFEFGVKHPQLEFFPGEEPVGRKKYRLHKNMESFNFYMGKDPYLDRYFDKSRAKALLEDSYSQADTERKYTRHLGIQVDNDEILRLKAQLREKELKLKELSDSFISASPPRLEVKRPPPLRPAPSISPEKLYEMSIRQQKESDETSKPNRSFSVEPPKSYNYREEIKPYASQMGPIKDLLKHPAFHQPRYTRSNPKASALNPITGLNAPVPPRSKTPDRMAHYGNMVFK